MNETNLNDILIDDIIFHCPHYTRGCQYLSPCCDKLFDCRLCHDIEMDENEPNIKKQHKINNYDVKKICCKKCGEIQDFSQTCKKCNFIFGDYICYICKFIDNTNKTNYYHCYKCGICRRGNREDYKHCDVCNGCFPESHFNEKNKKNKCSENKLNNNCPICLEDLFTSIINPTQLNCGHMIHITCLQNLTKTSEKCPLCQKTIYENKFKKIFLKFTINQTQMPDEYKDIKKNIYCNDCEKTSNINWHVVAMFCPHCDSYNTKEI
jgi:RING finger/CHY zinc finger protein 1